MAAPARQTPALASPARRGRIEIGPVAWRAGLAAILVLALALRVGIVLIPSHFTLYGDPVDYNDHAVSIALGHGYPPTAIASPGTPSAFRPPVYPYLLGALYAVVGLHLTAARLLGAVLGTLTVLLTAWLAATLWDRRVGLLAGTIAAVCPSLIALGDSLLSETVFLPVELGIALVILALRRGRAPLRLAALAGGLSAVAGLTRSEGILFVLPVLAAIATAPHPRGRRLAGALVALVACAAVLTPWTVRNAEAFHAFVPLNTQGGFTLIGQYNGISGAAGPLEAVPRIPSQIPGLLESLRPLFRRPGGINEAQLNSVYTHYAFAYIRRHPIHVPIAIGLDLLRMFNLGTAHQFLTGIALRQMSFPRSLWTASTVFIQVVAVIAIIGLVLRLVGRLDVRLGSVLVWALPLLSILFSSLVGGTVRYRAPADPFLILLAAVTLLHPRVRRRA